MKNLTGSEQRRKKMSEFTAFPDAWELLDGMIAVRERTQLQRDTIEKIQELIEKEGFEIAHRVMASMLGYGFSQIEKKEYKVGKFPLYRSMLWEQGGSRKIVGYPYVDHHYGIKSKETGREYIVLEPYGISSDDIKQLLSQCEATGLSFNIDGRSQHFAGWTIRIAIGNKDSE